MDEQETFVIRSADPSEEVREICFVRTIRGGWLGCFVDCFVDWWPGRMWTDRPVY